MYNVGDKVRLKLDAKDDTPLVIRAIKDANLFLCVSSCGNRRLWCCEFELELVETQTDIKQAIRELLLSDEFLAAFAKAWLKTPPINESELNLTLEPITGSESEAYYLDKLKNGESK